MQFSPGRRLNLRRHDRPLCYLQSLAHSLSFGRCLPALDLRL
jgi:hypothetical protein